MRNKRYISLLLITALLLTAAVSCGKPNLPEQSSFTSPEADQTTVPAPPPLTDGLTKPPQDMENEKTYEYSAKPDLTLVLERQKEILSLIKNKKPYNELITKKVNVNDFIQKFEPSPVGRIEYYYIVEIDENIGIECIRKSKSGEYYSIHELEQGGLVYIFYNSFDNGDDSLRLHNWFISQKSLSYKDFSEISEGSKLEDVKAIDPVASIYEQRVQNYKPAYNVLYSQHYLTDGILTLYYDRADGEWTVSTIDYQKDFQVFHWYRDTNPAYKAKILDIDAVK